MKIDPSGPLRPSQLRRADKTGRRNGDFVAHLESETPDPEAANTGSTVASVSVLLSLQEVGSVGEEQRRALRRGHDILDRLDELRHALLLGTLSRHDLQSLAHFVRDGRGRVEDPQLCQILDEIELRAEVEMAKYGG